MFNPDFNDVDLDNDVDLVELPELEADTDVSDFIQGVDYE